MTAYKVATRTDAPSLGFLIASGLSTMAEAVGAVGTLLGPSLLGVDQFLLLPRASLASARRRRAMRRRGSAS